MDFHQKPRLGQQINWEHPLAKGIIAAWLMNEGSGDRVCDSSLNRMDGTFSATAGDAPDWHTNGLDFLDGDDTVVSVLDKDILRPAQFSFSLRTRLHSIAEWDTWFRLDDVAHDWTDNYAAYLRADNFAYFFVGDWESAAKSAATLSTNVWYDIVGTFDGVTNKIYVNGVKGTDAANTAVWDTDVLNIGAYYTGGNYDLQGIMSHLIFWERALTANEVAQLSRNPYAMLAPFDAVVLFDWHLIARRVTRHTIGDITYFPDEG